MPVSKTKNHRTFGPNMKQVLSLLAAGLAAKGGAKTSADYVALLADPKRHLALTKLTLHVANEMLRALRLAPDNVWGDDEETLAGVVLEKLKEREV